MKSRLRLVLPTLWRLGPGAVASVAAYLAGLPGMGSCAPQGSEPPRRIPPREYSAMYGR